VPLLLQDGRANYIYGPGGMVFEELLHSGTLTGSTPQVGTYSSPGGTGILSPRKAALPGPTPTPTVGKLDPSSSASTSTDSSTSASASASVSNGMHFYHTDQMGSIRRLSTSAGVDTAETYNYDSYGKRLACSLCSVNPPFGYDGQYTDESGLQYLRARYYDPATQQFISRDPAEGSTGQPYAYAGGNPVNLGDPSGHCPICIAVGAGILVGVGIDVGMDLAFNNANFDLATSIGNSLKDPWTYIGAIPIGEVGKLGKLARLAEGAEKGEAVVASAGEEFLLDTNVVISHGRQYAESGLNVVKADITDVELRATVRSRPKMHMPGAASLIPSVPSSTNLDLRIAVRGELTAKGKGNFADGIIIATAFERNAVLVTSDKAVFNAVTRLGGRVIKP
jgi:RHS repeat-associated protein